MVKFKATHFDDTVNLPEHHPLRDFFVFMFKGIALVLAIYFALGLILELFVSRLSVEKEVWIWKTTGLAKSLIEEPLSDSEYQAYIQELFDDIPDDLKPAGYDFSIVVIEDEDPNALALPGGTIAVTTGLLHELDSENALTFVLGHELGHFENRDHLRGMGFGFAALTVSVLLAGQDQGVVSALSSVVGLGQLSYSRKQEKRADLHGIKTLMSTYGHVGGATEFFEKIEELEGHFEKYIPSVMRTHPGSDKRIILLEEHITQHRFPKEATRALDRRP